jgi:hypothetical protein
MTGHDLSRHALFLSCSLVLSVGLAGCTSDGGAGGPTGQDGKADGFGGPGCAASADMIAAARARLIQDEPDFYNADGFSDDVASVDGLDDLNGDGVADALVFPGWSYAGANAEQVVYLSDRSGCATIYAGHFGAESVTAAEDGAATSGVRDLTVVNASGCEVVISRYTFDGRTYVEAGSESEDRCHVTCLSDEELIAEARAQLVRDEPDFYNADGFSDGAASVERIEDLNEDSVADALVFPGWSYAGANTEQVVYLSGETDCPTIYAGHFGASSVTPTEDGSATNGVRDLEVVNTSSCEALIVRYTFDGEQYVEADSRTENICEEGQ